MILVGTLVALVLLMLLVERVGITRLTGTPAGREWVLRHRLLHPNSISLVRIPMGLLSIGFWHIGWQVTAVLWFAAWMITDLTDGTIARACNLQTESGKWLDPLSDKCMYFPPLLYFAWTGVLPASWVALLLVTDALGQASRLVVRKKAANSFGKAKTAFITILITITALDKIGNLPFVTDRLLELITFSCALLAFLSLYCKAIPDIWYANSLTLANFLCGLGAIWQILQAHPMRGFVLVFMGQFFDLFDGRMARKFGSTRYGAVFDDIADGTSFGLAIGFLIYHELGDDWIAGILAAAYIVCVIYRLIRFMWPTVKLGPGLFQGMPSPAGAMLAGSAALLFSDFRWVGLAFVVASAGLMISSIRYRHFGQKIWPNLPNSVRLLCFVFLMSLANIGIADKDYSAAFSIFCFATVLSYAVLGLDCLNLFNEQAKVIGDAGDE